MQTVAALALLLFLQKAKVDPNYVIEPGAKGEDVMTVQIRLARAHFSPGEIDAAFGDNLTRALRAYQEAHDLPVTGTVNAETWDLLDNDTQPGVINYNLEAEDTKGLPVLAAKFHCSPKLLELLNPGARFDVFHSRVRVPNIKVVPPKLVSSVVVDANHGWVGTFNKDGGMLSFYPASVGSAAEPVSAGEFTVAAIREKPALRVELSNGRYALQGAADAAGVGAPQANGSIAMTSWDAWELGHLVKKGTPVVVKKGNQ
jgi:hypothetical protein